MNIDESLKVEIIMFVTHLLLMMIIFAPDVAWKNIEDK
jgi:hypothetical protein